MQKIDITEVLRTAFDCVMKNFVTLCLVAALIYVPIGLVTVLLEDSLTDMFQGWSRRPTSQLFRLAGSINLLVYFLTDGLARGVMFLLVFDFLRGKTPNWADCFRVAFSRLGSLIFVSLLSSLGVALGFIACVIPGIFLLVMWALATPIVIAESVSATEAMSRSSELTKGNRLETFAILLIVGIAAFVVAGLIQFFILSISKPVLLNGGFRIGAQILYSLAKVPTAAVSASVIGVLYVRLRTLREGTDVGEMAKVFE